MKKILFLFLLSFVCKVVNAQLSVFADGYGAGATFVDFSGSINAVSIDNTVSHSGSSSLKAVVPSSSYTGGAITAAAAQNLSTYNAVSFWVKADASKTLNVSGISNNGTSAPLQAEYINLPVSTTWTKYIIPIPAPGKLTAQDGLFHFAEGSDEGPYTLWFDDIQYENSAAVGAFSPAIATQTISPLVGGTFTPGGQTLTVLVNGVSQSINVNLACFDFTSSNTAVATITNGVGTAVGAGTATITGSLNGVTAAGTITVNVSGAAAVPTVAAPTPTTPIANVISLFSNAYVDVPSTNWNPNWGQSTVVTDIQIAGNDTKKYANLNYQGIEFASAINASTMQFLHVDIWTPNCTAFDIFLINPGPVEQSYTVNPTASGWNSYNIPLSAYNTIALNNIFQIKLVGTPFGTSLVYMDNLYFYKTAPITVPIVAAPSPTRLPANVLSLYSDVYTNLAGTDWFPNWGQSTVVTDIQIAGNNTKKYETLNYQGVQFASAVDASTMQFLHLDLWTPNCTAFDVFLINPGPIEQAYTVNPTASGWNSIDIPLTAYNTIALNNIIQFKLVGTPFGSSIVYLDNIYFYKNPSVVPLVAAPIPTPLPANVLSLYSDTYTNLAGTDWFPNWGQSTVVSDIVIAGNNTKKYATLNYQGVQFASPVNASNMEFLHLDIWTPNCTAFDVFLINPGPVEQAYTVLPTASGWNSIDIPLTAYNTIALNNIIQFKLVGTPFGTSTVYLDNIYFYKTPTLVPLTAAPTPTRLPAFVNSLYSDAYTNLAGTDWFPNWGQSTVVSDILIAGNNTKKYATLNYQGVQFASAVNASTMQFLHLDLWTPNCTAFDVFLINPGPVEQAYTVNPTASGWNSIDIPLTAYNTIALNNIIQFKLVGTPFGTSTVYLDNIYFYKNPPTAPLVAAPTPNKPAANVISLFSNAYANVPNIDWFPNWGQSTVVSDVLIAGNDTKKYATLNYQGVQFASPINASAMEFLHFDLWTGDCTAFDLFLINTSPATVEQKVTVTPTAFGWNSFDIPLSSYNTIALNNIGQFKLVGTPFGSSNLFLDNIYFHNTPTLSVLATTLTVASAASSTANIAVSSNTAWTATSNQTWLSVSPASGTGTASIVVTAQENLTVNTRTAVITIAAPGLPSKTVTIVQDGAVPAVALSTNALSIAAPANSIQTFSVASNTSWSITSNQTWLSASQTNGSGNSSIVLIAQANPTTNPRVAIITITGLNVAPKTITVTQDGIPPTLSVSSNALSIAAPANSTQTFNVVSNTSWTVVSSQTWLALSSPSGTGNSQLTLTAQANPIATSRTATVTISVSGVPDQIITVTQDAAAAILILPVSTLTIAAPANSTKTFAIISNTNWTVASSNTWLVASSATGSANATITLTAQANPTTTTRTATITVTAPNVAPQTITVTQEAALPVLAVSANTLSIAAPANSQNTVNITSNTAWTATSSQTWLTLSSASGSNNATLTLTAQANPVAAPRTAIVTISTAGLPNQIITVTQDAAVAVLTVSANALTIAAPANSTKKFDVVANTNWTLVSSATWLTASSASGTTNATITLTAQANPTISTRTATITLSASGVPNQIITVTQEAAAAVLSLSANALTVAAPANSTKTFDVVSNTTWTLINSGNWFTASSTTGTGNTTITLTAQANPNPSIRIDTVTVSAAGLAKQVVIVTQDAAGTILVVSATTLAIAAPANSTQTFDITSNLNWSLASSAPWLTTSVPNGTNNATITLTAQANPSTTPRTATITISGTGVGNQTILVTQAGALPTLAVSATALSIAAPANSTKTFDVTSNTAWTLTSNQSWLVVNTTAGTNNATITLTAQENVLVATRTATVVLSALGVADQTITVTQDAAAPTLSISATVVTIAAPANSTGTFDVFSNTNWNVSSSVTWLTLTKTPGSTTQITITAQANPTTAPRTTTVTVNVKNLPSQTVTVTQEGAAVVMTVSAATLKMAAPANSTQKFDITSNTAWTVASNQSWLAINTATGTGNSNIILTAQANTTNATRTATITVKGTGATDKVIVVTQDFMVGTENIALDQLPFSIYPNPVSENLFIRLADANTSSIDLKINDLTGKVLMQFSQINLQEHINVSTLPSGVYFIQLMDDTTKAVSTRKFVKL